MCIKRIYKKYKYVMIWYWGIQVKQWKKKTFKNFNELFKHEANSVTWQSKRVFLKIGF